MSILASLKKLFRKPFQTVNAADVAGLLAGGAVLLDVRDKHEWQAGHAPKARHIPLSQLPNRLGELSAAPMIITVCRSGMRSAQAARLLAGHGRPVVNLSGGMHAWARAGLPVTAKSGTGRII